MALSTAFETATEHGVWLGRLLLQTADDSADVNITWEGGLVIATVIMGLIIMACDLVGPDFIFAGLAAFYMACRIITVRQGSAGFANTAVLTVVALYVVAEGIAQTGGLEKLMSGVLGKTSSPFWATMRMFFPALIAAAFLNNTPIVVMLIPIVISWGMRRGVSPKKLLIPLSYATILGGLLTLIGTSTNLVVAGLQRERYTELGQPENASFGFFDITPFGITYACFGFVYIMVAGRWLLPADAVSKADHGVLMAARIKPGSKLHQKTVRSAGLKGMSDLFLVSVDRAGHMAHAVGPDFLLEEGDNMYFSGSLRAAEALAEKLELELLTADSESLDEEGSPPALRVVGAQEDEVEEAGLPAKTKLVQVTVRKNSELIGCTVRDSRLLERFGCRVLAVKRGEVPQGGKLSGVVLKQGDALVLTAGENLDVKSDSFRAMFKDATVLSATQEKEYMTGMRVQKRARMVGKSLGEAGLIGVNGLAVVAVDRESGELVRDVDDSTVVEAGDILWFSGSLDGVAYLLRLPGLAHMQDGQIAKLGISVLERRLVQASIALESPLAGLTVREAHFRSRFDSVVISISRHGQKLHEDVRDVRLQAGDVLLLDTGSQFTYRYKSDRAFSLLNEVPNTSPLKTSRMWWALCLATVMIATQVVAGAIDTPTIDLFPAAVLTGGIMILTRCMTGEQARISVNWTIYVTIAFAFAVSAALEETTVANGIASIFQDISEKIGGETAPLVAMYIATALLSELITNNAAAALMYPIASRLGDALGIEPVYMSVAVMLGASASFITPIGYQVNLMVFAAGGYRMIEFIRFGTLLQVTQVCAALLIFSFKSQPWIVAAMAVVAVACFITVCAVWSFLLSGAVKQKMMPPFMKRRRSPMARQV